MMAERAIGVDHSTVHRWVIKLVPLFEKTFRKHKRRICRNNDAAVEFGLPTLCFGPR
jgi:transposase-like protein